MTETLSGSTENPNVTAKILVAVVSFVVIALLGWIGTSVIGLQDVQAVMRTDIEVIKNDLKYQMTLQDRIKGQEEQINRLREEVIRNDNSRRRR